MNDNGVILIDVLLAIVILCIFSIPVFMIYSTAPNVINASRIQLQMEYTAQTIMEKYKVDHTYDPSDYKMYDIDVKEETPDENLPENIVLVRVKVRLKSDSTKHYQLITYMRK